MNNNICVVPGCKNIQEKNITLHEFPLTNFDLSLKWLNAINRENWVPSRNSKICSEHFKDSDFEVSNASMPFRLKLKSDVVPSRKLQPCNFTPKVEVIEHCSYHLPIPPESHFCCVWGCTINSVKHPKNTFHLLPINHQLTICDCIELETPIDPILFLSKSLEICDQHFKQNAMLLYINTEITSTSKIKIVNESSPVLLNKSNNIHSTTKDTAAKENHQNKNDDVILNEEDLLHFDFSLNKKQKSFYENKNLLRDALTKNQDNVQTDEFYDIDNICRICLHGGQLISIYGRKYDNVFINDMVGSFINLNNPIEKKFPRKVCFKCLPSLKIAYKFVNESKRSTNILDKFVKQQNDAALKSLQYDHNYDKFPVKRRINIQELMENAGINIFDTLGGDEIEGTITEPEELLQETTIPPEIIQKIKNTALKDSAKKVPKNVLESITEKTNLNIGGKQFILAKAFTCKKCNEIYFSQELFNAHVHTCDFKPNEKNVNSYNRKCKKCSKVFKNQFGEITHNCLPLKKLRRKPFQCSKCNENLKCLSLYANHKCNPEKVKQYERNCRRAKDRLRHYKCKECNEMFLSHKSLTIHIKLIHPDKIPSKIPKCKYCSLTFTNADELKKHRETSHGQNRIVTCPTCMRLMTAAQYHAHKVIHSVERRYCCEFCGKRFKSQTCFRCHVNRVHLGLKPFACDICNRAYNTKAKMLEHRNVHSGVKKYMCDSCGARFTYSSCLTSHIKLKRCGKTKGIAREHQCPNCDEILMSRRLLIQHKREAHGARRGTQKTLLCEVCKIPCESPADLRIHEALHGEKQFVCDQTNCKRAFFTAERLQRHLKVHEIVNVKCEICSKGFYSNLSLKLHMKTHTGEKNYHCTYCPKQFTQQGHLVSHTRTHTGAKPYQCPFCDKAFAMNGNLTVHIRTHTGQRPYECNFCDRAFFDASSRKRHMVHRHGYGIKQELLSNDMLNNDSN